MRFKAKNYKPGVEWEWAHAKLDGHRVECRWYDRLRILKPKQDITEHVQHLPWYQTMMAVLPMNHCIEGELWVPGRKASHVSRAIAEQHDDLRFTAFCAPSLPHDCTITQLAMWMRDTCPGIEFAAWVQKEQYDPTLGQPMPTDWMIGDGPAAWQEHLRNIEGWVLKQANMSGWYKLKEERTIDLVVTGTKDGKGKNLGLVGSLLCSLADGREVANVSGMTDEERVDMSMLDEDELIGKVVEVKYQYVGDGGRLRHPVFVRFRDDKTAEECTAEQDDEL